MKKFTKVSLLSAGTGVGLGFIPLLSYFQPLLFLPLLGLLGYKVWKRSKVNL